MKLVPTPAAFLLAVLGGCEHLPTEPRLHSSGQTVLCELPAALLTGVRPQPIASGPIRAALLHAAGPLVSSLGWSEEVKQLVAGLESLAASDPSMPPDAECRLLVTATEAFAALPDDPETLPDRDGIRMILMLAAETIKGD